MSAEGARREAAAARRGRGGPPGAPAQRVACGSGDPATPTSSRCGWAPATCAGASPLARARSASPPAEVAGAGRVGHGVLTAGAPVDVGLRRRPGRDRRRPGGGAARWPARSSARPRSTTGPPTCTLVVLAADGRARAGTGRAWLPHARLPDGTGRLLAAGRPTADALVEALRPPDEGAGPGRAPTAGRRGEPAGPVRLYVVDDPTLLQGRRAPLRDLLRGDAGPATGIVIAPTEDLLPHLCTTVVTVRPGTGEAIVRQPAARRSWSTPWWRRAGRRHGPGVRPALARFEDPELGLAAAHLPRVVRLPELLDLDDAADVGRHRGPLAAPGRRPRSGDAHRPRRGGRHHRRPRHRRPPRPGRRARPGRARASCCARWCRAWPPGPTPTTSTFVLVDYKGGSAFDACARPAARRGHGHRPRRAPRASGRCARSRPRSPTASAGSARPGRPTCRPTWRPGRRRGRCRGWSWSSTSSPRWPPSCPTSSARWSAWPSGAAAWASTSCWRRSGPGGRSTPTSRPTPTCASPCGCRTPATPSTSSTAPTPPRWRGRRRGGPTCAGAPARSRSCRPRGPRRRAARRRERPCGSPPSPSAPPRRRPSPLRAYARAGRPRSGRRPGGDVGPPLRRRAAGLTEVPSTRTPPAPPAVPGPPATPAARAPSASGTPAPVDPQPTVPAPPADPTDLDQLVDAVVGAFEASGAARPRQPWLPMLPDRVPLVDVAGATPDAPGTVPFALADDPDRQRQAPVGWTPAEGHLALFGMVGSGTTTAAVAAVLALCAQRSPDDCHVYGIDYGGGGLAPLAALPHTGSILGARDREAQVRLVRQLRAELDRRRDLPPANVTDGDATAEPLIVCVIDGIAPFLAEFPVTDGDRRGRRLRAPRGRRPGCRDPAGRHRRPRRRPAPAAGVVGQPADAVPARRPQRVHHHRPAAPRAAQEVRRRASRARAVGPLRPGRRPRRRGRGRRPLASASAAPAGPRRRSPPSPGPSSPPPCPPPASTVAPSRPPTQSPGGSRARSRAQGLGRRRPWCCPSASARPTSGRSSCA